MTRIVLEAELFAMVLWFDVESTMRMEIIDHFEKKVPLKFYTD